MCKSEALADLTGSLGHFYPQELGFQSEEAQVRAGQRRHYPSKTHQWANSLRLGLKASSAQEQVASSLIQSMKL